MLQISLGPERWCCRINQRLRLQSMPCWLLLQCNRCSRIHAYNLLLFQATIIRFFTKTMFAFGHFGHFGHYLNILPCRMFDLQSVVAICRGQIEDRLCSICNRRVRHIEGTFSDRSRIRREDTTGRQIPGYERRLPSEAQNHCH